MAKKKTLIYQCYINLTNARACRSPLLPSPLLLPPSPLPSLLPTTLIVFAIALFVAVAVAHPPPSLQSTSMLPLPLQSIHL
jgi:hypothetical protein